MSQLVLVSLSSEDAPGLRPDFEEGMPDSLCNVSGRGVGNTASCAKWKTEKLDTVSIISDFQSSVPDLFSVSKDTLR